MKRLYHRAIKRALYHIFKYDIVRRAIYRVSCEIYYYPYYLSLMVVLILWLAEGVAMQSGWASCPRP